MKSKRYTFIDQILLTFDERLRTHREKQPVSVNRPYPAESFAETVIDKVERQHISGLMRVNHAGEMAAQALYKAQALTAKDKALKQSLQQSAAEERDHLAWCELRLSELGDHVSYLSPLWYGGSFGLGLLAGGLAINGIWISCRD